MGLYKLRHFCTEKETIDRVKRQSTEWKKTFSIYVSEYTRSPKIQHNNPAEKWTKDLDRYFSKEEIENAKKMWKKNVY